MNSPKIPTPAVCPRCGCWYQAGVQRCLDDGSALLRADNMVRLFGPEDMSSQNDTIVEVVVRGAAHPEEGLAEAAARLKGGPSTMLMEASEARPARPADEATRPPERPLVLEADLGEARTTLRPDGARDQDGEPPTLLVTLDTGAKPWVPLDPSDFESAAPAPARRGPRWPRQPPGRERVSFLEISTWPEAAAEPDTEIVVDRDGSSVARLARHRRVTRRGFAIPLSRRVERMERRTPGLTQHTPTLLRTGTPPAGLKSGS